MLTCHVATNMSCSYSMADSKMCCLDFIITFEFSIKIIFNHFNKDSCLKLYLAADYISVSDTCDLVIISCCVDVN